MHESTYTGMIRYAIITLINKLPEESGHKICELNWQKSFYTPTLIIVHSFETIHRQDENKIVSHIPLPAKCDLRHFTCV